MKAFTTNIRIAVPPRFKPTFIDIEAVVFGQWAAHPEWLATHEFHPQRWTLTHVPSGYCVPTRSLHVAIFDEALAITMAAMIDARGVNGETRSEVIRKRAKLHNLFKEYGLL